MAKVSISEAAKLAGVSRSHFYKRYIKPGQISVLTDDVGTKSIETSELIRVFGELSPEHSREQKHTPQDNEENKATLLENKRLNELLEIKQKQLDESASREQRASERELFLQHHIQELASGIKLLENKQLTEKKNAGFWDWFKSS